MAARTIEEHEAELTELRGRIQEIDTEFAGEALPDDIRGEWDEKNLEIERKGELIEELRARMKRVEDLTQDPNAQERGASFHTDRPGVVKGDDIYDLSTVRSSYANPDEARREIRDRALRAVETASFPILQKKRDLKVSLEDCQAHVEGTHRAHAGADARRGRPADPHHRQPDLQAGVRQEGDRAGAQR
jgi:hypothetical protein